MEFPCVRELPFHRVVMRKILAGVCLTHVDESRLDAALAIFSSERIERWTRHPAVGSGKRSELEYRQSEPRDFRQAHRLTGREVVQLWIGCPLTDPELGGKSFEHRIIHIERKGGVVVLLGSHLNTSFPTDV